MNGEINKLSDFFYNVKNDIDYVVYKIHEINPELKLFYPEIDSLYLEMVDIWKNIVSSHFEGIQSYLRNKQNQDKIKEQLEHSGFEGHVFEFELKIYDLRRDEALRAWDDYLKTDQPEEEKKEKRSHLRRILGKLFRFMDLILDKLAFIRKTAAIKEFKQIIE